MLVCSIANFSARCKKFFDSFTGGIVEEIANKKRECDVR
jgi:hypothetical protein